MNRTVSVLSAFLLTTSSIARSEDREPSFIDPGIKPYELGVQQQYFRGVDTNISPQEYEGIYFHNRKLAYKTLRSYSNDVLKMIGIPEQGGYLMGSAFGLVINHGLGLDLNKSKTLALEFKDVDKPERALNFRIRLDW